MRGHASMRHLSRRKEKWGGLMKILLKLRNYILVIFIALFAAMLGLHLAFGRSEEKIMIAILSIIMTGVMYAFARFLFYVISLSATEKLIVVFSYCFLGLMLIYLVLGLLLNFVLYYPNGFSPMTGGIFAFVLGVIDGNQFKKKDK